MPDKNIVLQFASNGILILSNNNIKYEKIKSVDNYKVINKKLFLSEIKEIVNNYNLINTIKCIKVIIDKTYNDLEKISLKCLLVRFSQKVEFLDIGTILYKNDNEIFIDISSNNIKVYYRNRTYYSKIYFKEYEEILRIYLQNITKLYPIKLIKLFGNYNNLDNISSFIEKKLDIPVYILSYPNIIPIKYLLK